MAPTSRSAVDGIIRLAKLYHTAFRNEKFERHRCTYTAVHHLREKQSIAFYWSKSYKRTTFMILIRINHPLSVSRLGRKCIGNLATVVPCGGERDGNIWTKRRVEYFCDGSLLPQDWNMSSIRMKLARDCQIRVVFSMQTQVCFSHSFVITVVYYHWRQFLHSLHMHTIRLKDCPLLLLLPLPTRYYHVEYR